VATGATVAAGACLNNPACLNAVEVGGSIATGSDLPPTFSAGGGFDVTPNAQTRRLGIFEGDLREFDIELSGTTVVMYKGMPGGWDEGDIMPAGWYNSPNPDYSTGGLRRTFSSDEIFTGWIDDHTLAGQTGHSPFSSWTPDSSYARRYAKEGGCIVKCEFDTRELIDVADYYAYQTTRDDAWRRLSYAYGDTPETTSSFFGNLNRILTNKDEYLHFGVVPSNRVSPFSGSVSAD